ncbi:hypothetical protein PSM36_2261 [Proteiniphilum saccharofermentans]|uniref:Uncharacterized protein n=1 Tax=Proteiniphilum saccharofermentans TaxID=1642647 RepID=A0A1R3SXZ8_9BACT|nr:hypothetical protein [Proteiniphilum saccharofermentans]SCD21066.1 hypothetical protein PSM36_2261 [Proteiniphilum saccharofermentans]
MEKIVGINQRISINVIEMAIKACLDGSFTSEYAADLAAGEYQGTNRINKARTIIGKLTQRNPLFPFIKEHKQEYLTAIKYTGDKAIIYSALINAAYGFGYDAMVILGKFFHVQEQVSTNLIINRMSSIYASNRSLSNGLYCIMPMYIEAGLISRQKVGVYTRKEKEIVTSFARDLYAKSFFVNNPMLEEGDYDYAEHPYFEFI